MVGGYRREVGVENPGVLFEHDGLQAKYLDPDDAPALQGLFEECAADDVGICGLPTLGDESTFELGCVIGLFDQAEDLVGVLDALPDHPEAGKWTVGLMLIEPGRRGEGLGAGMYRAFEAWARDEGARDIRLGVREGNADARRFFEGLGFRVVGTLPHAHEDTLVMSRVVDES